MNGANLDGGGVTAADMAMLAGTKAAGWFAVSAIAWSDRKSVV